MNDFFQFVYAKVATLPFGDVLFLFIMGTILFNITLIYGFTGYIEMKLIGHIHSRKGPVYTGPLGILQPIADALKVLQKEVIFPHGFDRFLFTLPLFLLTIPNFLAIIFIPVGSFIVFQSDYSLLIALGLLSMSPIAILLGSWASNSKYSTLGGLRSAGMTMSYEVLLGVAIASVIVTTGSMDIVKIVEYQAAHGLWFAVMQPFAFLLFLVGTIAAVERNPFDLVEAESELVSGWRTEYGGVYFLVTLIAEYIKLFVVLLLFTSLFLGGWMDFAGDVGFFVKVLVLTLLMVYIRATAIRLRLDQILAKVWHKYIPLGILNFIITLGVLEVLG
ncbi:MAG: NADH-quinone oxidoreductase subunit H [Candidatus Woesearchaeota archaeon]|nr:NADH-quinone oxidoreductase subunit H [Candidatus Woesearchaeota archaeon]